MANEIANMADFSEKLKHAVTTHLVNIIPEEVLDKIVQDRITRFIYGTEKYENGKKLQETPSELDVMIDNIIGKTLNKLVGEKLREAFDWDGKANEAFKLVIAEVLKDPDVVSNMFRAQAIALIETFKFKLQNEFSSQGIFR